MLYLKFKTCFIYSLNNNIFEFKDLKLQKTNIVIIYAFKEKNNLLKKIEQI